MKEEMSQWKMGVFAVCVGIIAGFGAVVFRGMIGAIHNLMFLGQFSFYYNANLHTPASPWGIGIIFVPVIGSVVVVFLVKNFAPEAKGHGVPEVMSAIYSKEGKIRPIVAVIKSIASAITIGTGGAVGREGPIVQIGSAFGSILGGILKITPRQRNILIAAGAAGGIAATFNTPIGALAFAIELILVSVTAKSLFPVAISTVTATYIGRIFLGTTPSFYIPELTIPNFHLIALKELAIFVPFGIIIGLGAVIFIKGLYWFEDLFDAMPGNYYSRHMLGMFLVGILMYLMIRFTGHYYIQGVGYATIVDTLKGTLTNPLFLFALFLLKLLSNFLTLGSGGSGGIFSPSLFFGATLGAAFGSIVHMIFPQLGATTIVFAMAGMAGMIGGTTGAVLTGTIMVIEMTQNSNVVLPILITVTTAYAVRKMLSEGSIYTLKLLRRGETVPEGLQSAVILAQTAAHIMASDFRVVSLFDFKTNLIHYMEEPAPRKITIVINNNHVMGIMRRTLEKEILNLNIDENIDLFLNQNFLIFSEKTSLPIIMRAMKIRGARFVLITAGRRLVDIANIVGVITETEILEASLQAVSLV